MSCDQQGERISSVIDKIKSRLDVPEKDFDKVCDTLQSPCAESLRFRSPLQEAFSASPI